MKKFIYYIIIFTTFSFPAQSRIVGVHPSEIDQLPMPQEAKDRIKEWAQKNPQTQVKQQKKKIPNQLPQKEFTSEEINNINKNFPLILKSYAEQSNKDFPVMSEDSLFRIDRVEAKDNALIYEYTIVDYKADEINKNFGESIKNALVNMRCIGEESQIFKIHKVQFVENYHDKNGKLVVSVAVDTGQCDFLLNKNKS